LKALTTFNATVNETPETETLNFRESLNAVLLEAPANSHERRATARLMRDEELRGVGGVDDRGDGVELYPWNGSTGAPAWNQKREKTRLNRGERGAGRQDGLAK
jgi:hypothetical protein